MFRILSTLVLMTSIVLPALAQTEVRGDLKRRAGLGIQLAENDAGQVVVRGLIPGGSAAACGIEVDDLILRFAEREVSSRRVLADALQGFREGDRCQAVVQRGDETKTIEISFKGRPLESAEDFAILYDVVTTDDAKLRSITTRPKAEGKQPAILFIQGLQTTTTEFQAGRSNTIKEFIYGMTRRGFVVMRCEKSGVGDSTGEPASEAGFEVETAGFGEAFEKLASYDFVDPERIYVFGHSMGGIMAPLIAPGKKSAGIVVFGTGLRPWSEYLVTNTRRQMKLGGVPFGDIDDALRDYARLHFYTLVEKWTIEKLEKERPELKEAARAIYPDGLHYGGRHLSFFQELEDANMPRAWTAVEAPVLAIHGEYDWVSSADDHEGIAEIVNAQKPGRGRFLSLPGTFHGFDLHESLEDSLRNAFRGPFNERLLDEVATFCGAKR